MSGNAKYILYGTEHSFYTGKIRPYLRYKGIPYEERLATLWTYSRFIIPRTGVQYIPVVHTPDDVVIQDTTEIIDAIEQRFNFRSVYPETPKQKLVALLFELYGDEWFTLPAMHFRWSFLKQQEQYVMEEFGNVAGRFLPSSLKRIVGKQVSKPFKNALKPLGIDQATIPKIEAWYAEFLRLFSEHLKHQPYLLGSRPCVGDFALAGPMYAHMWKDPVPGKRLEKDAPLVVNWIKRINEYPQSEGRFLSGDVVPETLNPMLEHLFKELWPLLQDTAEKLPSWIKDNPNKKEISRVIGHHRLSIAGEQSDRLMYPYGQWMMQRSLDFYQSLSDGEKAEVDILLRQVDGIDCMQFHVPQRVERRNNKLVAA